MRILGVDQPGAVDELPLTAHECVIELREILRGDAEIRIQNHQNVPGGLRKAQAHGIAFAPALLDQDRNVFLQSASCYTPTLLERVIFGMAFNKNEFRM